jgi:hypothetical protein
MIKVIIPDHLKGLDLWCGEKKTAIKIVESMTKEDLAIVQKYYPEVVAEVKEK